MHETCYTCTICQDEQLSNQNPYGQTIWTSFINFNLTKHLVKLKLMNEVQMVQFVWVFETPTHKLL